MLVKTTWIRTQCSTSFNKKIEYCYWNFPDVMLFFSIWVFPTIGVLQNGWFRMENPIQMDDLRVPPMKETPISFHMLFWGGCLHLPDAKIFTRGRGCPGGNEPTANGAGVWRAARRGWSWWSGTKGGGETKGQGSLFPGGRNKVEVEYQPRERWSNSVVELWFSRTHPGRLTWNLKMMVWKMMFLFQWSSLRLVPYKSHINPI